jgi:HPt (histidine-containing phosphotransfer) domain-containing protein
MDKLTVSDESIAWLDEKRCFERFGSDRDSYALILRSFVASTNSLLAGVKGVAGDNLADYAITVHGIKGASRSICADKIGNMAEELEKAAKSGDFSFVRAGNMDFIKAIEELLSRINDILNELASENPKIQKDRPDTGTLVKLLAACREYDMDGVDAAMTEMESFEYGSDNGLAAWLRENVDLMNFGQIEEKLSALVGSTE